jgi:hypothetical protein
MNFITTLHFDIASFEDFCNLLEELTWRVNFIFDLVELNADFSISFYSIS